MNRMNNTAEQTASTEELKSSLHEYYEQQEIAVGPEFKCPHGDECQRAVPRLLMGQGSEAHVGSRYGNPFRIVVVSSDRAEGALDVWNRSSEIEGLRTDGEGLNPHMKGTLATLTAILCDRKSENVWTQFAIDQCCEVLLWRRRQDCRGSRSCFPAVLGVRFRGTASAQPKTETFESTPSGWEV